MQAGQKVPKSDAQSKLSMSRIILISLFFSINNNGEKLFEKLIFDNYL
jgi:hypothetical protein